MLLVAILSPLAGAVLGIIASLRWRATIAFLTCLVAALAVLSMFPALLEGQLNYYLPGVLGLGLHFSVDWFSWGLAMATVVVWLLVCACSPAWVAHLPSQGLYYLFLMLCLGFTLGIFVSGDLFTLFVFFELMTLTSYILVVHTQKQEAMKGGATYLYLSIAGGLSLLFGILALAVTTGGTTLEPALESILASGTHPAVVAVPMLIGFGLKAGVVPLHLWMGRVYPVMMAPVCALSSGILIKTGVYGIARTVLVVLRPLAAEGMAFGEALGIAVLSLGLLSMIFGALMACWQVGFRRILAFSSVSQVGYMMTGIGVAAIMGVESGLGFAGTFYHMLNHALFKAGLFLIWGLMALDSFRGWSWRLAVPGLIMVLAKVGLPGLNGYASKTVLHDALLELNHLHPSLWTTTAERVFVVGSALTLVYMIRLGKGLLVEQRLAAEPRPEARAPQTALILLSVLMLGIGLFPSWLLERLMIPAVLQGGLALGHLKGLHFWDSHPLGDAGLSLSLGVAIYVVASRFGWLGPRRWLVGTAEAILVNGVNKLAYGVGLVALVMEYGLNAFYRRIALGLGSLLLYMGVFNERMDSGCEQLGVGSGKALARLMNGLDYAAGGTADRLSKGGHRAAQHLSTADNAFDRLCDWLEDASRSTATKTARMDSVLEKFWQFMARWLRNAVDHTARMDSGVEEGHERFKPAGTDAAGEEGESGDESGRAVDQPEPEFGPNDRMRLRRSRMRASSFGSANYTISALVVAVVLMGLLYFVMYGTRP